MFQRLKKSIENHAGLCFRPGDSELLCKALSVRMKRLSMDSPDEYLRFLEGGAEASCKEWKALIPLITTGESYFFRDKGHISLLQNSILPELIKSKRAAGRLRIWSAGCSTGEEPYSVAILLDQLLPEPKEWDVVIIGTDINEAFLEKAVSGKFSEWSFRMMDKDLQRKYFKRRTHGWEIQENIKKMVRFQYANLLEADFFVKNPEICDMDIIICRNVFIYFNTAAVALVLKNFDKILSSEGYLITGHGELYGHELRNLKQIISPEAVIYKKTLAGNKQPSQATQIPDRINEHGCLKLKVKPPVKPILPASPVQTKPTDPKTEIEELINTGKYSEAVAKAKCHIQAQQESDGILFLMASAYANSGDYENAESCCLRAMRCNAAAAEPYFLLAHIAELKGNDESAKELLRKTIYLNPAHIAAYCELGGLYAKQHDLLRAKKVRATAIELLASLPGNIPVKPYNINAEELLAYLRSLQQEKM